MDVNQQVVVRPAMGELRQRFWPVYADELKKFIPMVVIMFWVLFNYTLVRNIKDNILVHAPYGSSQCLPWAKVLFVTPASILFVVMYAKLSNSLSQNALYYACLIPFLAFFFLFGFCIYPYHSFFNFSPETVLSWQQHYPSFTDLFPVLGYWTFTLFYMMAELWGNVGVALLFWQVANRVTPTSQAKRFYPIFGFWSNLALVLAGLILTYGEPILEKLSPVRDGLVKIIDYSLQVKLFCACVVLGCVIIGLTYRWMSTHVFTDPRHYDEALLMKKGKEKKPKLSIGESFSFLMQSKYLGYVAILVLAYGVAINIIEISWKNSVKAYFNNDIKQYSSYMGSNSIYTGVITMILIAVGQPMVRMLGWRISAGITPWVSLITGGLFFVFLIFKDSMAGICALLGETPAGVAIWLGLAQNVLTKGAKYSLFDPTKEMTYIPLDQESKVKGKAAIDVVGGRAGKSGGSIINMLFKWTCNKFSLSINCFYLAICGVLVGICLWWLWALNQLSKEYQQKLEEQNKGEEKDKASTIFRKP